MSGNDAPNRTLDARSGDLEARLGYHFRNGDLLIEALTHSSLSGGGNGVGSTYERLEFLGDRVLALVVAAILLETFPDENEGALARRHAMLVRKETLADVADELDLGADLRLAKGQDDAGGRRNPGMLADACEAVIAAIYLDGGFDAVSTFIRRHWQPLADQDARPPKDPKTTLQEWAQGHGRPLPQYREIARTGPAHAPTFEVEVSVEGCGPVSALGTSKRAAERAAAEVMLESINDVADG